MDYKEFLERTGKLPPTGSLRYITSAGWPYHPAVIQYPVILADIGEDDSGIIKVPAKAENRFGKTVSVKEVSAGAFRGNVKVSDIVFPTDIRSFAAGAFAGCSNLKRMTFPKAVKYIDEGTFRGCISLEDVYYEGTEEEWNAIYIEHKRFRIDIVSFPTPSALHDHLLKRTGNEDLLRAKIHYNCNFLEKAL